MQLGGRLPGVAPGVVLGHRTKTMRTTSFRQVIRSASEGDALALQAAEPANALQVTAVLHQFSQPPHNFLVSVANDRSRSGLSALTSFSICEMNTTRL